MIDGSSDVLNVNKIVYAVKSSATSCLGGFQALGAVNLQEEKNMGLQARLQDELKKTIKSKDTARTGAIRIMIGEFQRLPTKELNDEQVVAVIKKLIKSEKELLAVSGQASSQYLAIMEGYLPRQATMEEIRAYIRENIDLKSFKTPMQAMRPIMAHFGAAADGATVQSVLAEFA